MKNTNIFRLYYLLFVLVCTQGCKKDDTITFKDAELVGNWRLDSMMYLTASTAYFVDTIYFGDAPNKRFLMTIKEDNTFTFEHISKEVVGKGSFIITEFKGIKSTAYATVYPLKIYLVAYYYLEAMNNAKSYSIKGNQLSIFYAEPSSSIARFTRE